MRILLALPSSPSFFAFIHSFIHSFIHLFIHPLLLYSLSFFHLISLLFYLNNSNHHLILKLHLINLTGLVSCKLDRSEITHIQALADNLQTYKDFQTVSTIMNDELFFNCVVIKLLILIFHR